MGNAATRSLERVAAAMVALEPAPVEFEAACDEAGGGVLLALVALARVRSMEQLRYAAPGEWGHLLGLDRIPEVRTETRLLLTNHMIRYELQSEGSWRTARRQ